TWGLIAWQTQDRWLHEPTSKDLEQRRESDVETPFDRWQTAKGLVVAALLLLAFLYAPWPREHVALTAAGVLLMSRKLHSNKMLGLVDWELLVMFIGLFVINHALQSTGLVDQIVGDLASIGLDLRELAPLFGAIFALSNIVSNVPAV